MAGSTSSSAELARSIKACSATVTHTFGHPDYPGGWFSRGGETRYLSPDGLAAYLEVGKDSCQDASSPQSVDVAAALAFLADAGIIYGVNPEYVEWAVEEREIPVLVAQGRSPVPGSAGGSRC